MPENNKTDEFLKKLAPCIEKGELDACVNETVRLAEEVEIGALELLDLSVDAGATGLHALTYVMALSAAQGLERNDKATAHYNAGVAAYSLGKVELSEEQYKLAIEANPKDAPARINYGSLLKDLNRVREAEEQYIKAIETGQELAYVHYNYAILLNEINRVEEAEKQYKLAIDSDTKYAGACYNYANLLKKLNRAEEAEEQYKLAIQRDSKYASAHLNYGVLLKDLNRVEEAEEQYKLAIQTNPKLAEAHYNYANLLKELKRHEEAEEHYSQAVELKQKYADAHNNYANLLEELDRWEEAEKHYKLAIEAAPKDAKAHYNYAYILRENELFSVAEEEVKIALQIEPNDPYALGTLGDIYSDEGYYDEAIKEYQKALNNSASMQSSVLSEVHNNLGFAYVNLKKYGNGKKQFQKALSIDTMNIKATRNLRALGKVGDKTSISKSQVCVSILLFIPLVASYHFFITKSLSETGFVAQSTFLISLLTFIIFYHQLARVKIGAIEFEKSEEHRSIEAKSQPVETISKMERF